MREAAKKKQEHGLINEEIGRRAGVRLDVPAIDESRVSRCLTGDTSTFDLVEAISDVLGIPSPVVIADSLTEARELAAIRASYEKAARLAAGHSGIAKVRGLARAVAKRHTDELASTHGTGVERPGGGANARRGGTRRS
jgi:hypothetical protein